MYVCKKEQTISIYNKTWKPLCEMQEARFIRLYMIPFILHSGKGKIIEKEIKST